MDTTNSRAKPFGLVQIGIIVLGLATAFIHLYLATEIFASGNSGLLFVLNGVGYLTLLAALFLPIPVVKNYRSIWRILLILFTLTTIIAWVFMGARNAWGYTDKAIEIALVILLWLDRSRS